MADTLKPIDLIAKTVDLYFQGLYHSDVEKLKIAFGPQARVVGTFQGNPADFSLDEFLGIVGQTPAPSGQGEAYDMRIVSVDVTGDVALVKVEDLYLGLRFTDYLTLYEKDGGWIIIHKAFYHQPVG